MGFILGIDPDLHNAGVALWGDGCKTISHSTARHGIKVVDKQVTYERHPPFLATLELVSVDPDLRRWRAVESMCDALPGRLREILQGYYDVSIDLVVVEAQRKYPNSPVQPNDLIQLAAVAGAAASAALGFRRPRPRLWMPEPREWKGQQKKHPHQERILERVGLTWKQAKQTIGTTRKEDARHAVDALGLALKGAERLEASRR